jgi:hypothetical protein
MTTFSLIIYNEYLNFEIDKKITNLLKEIEDENNQILIKLNDRIKCKGRAAFNYYNYVNLSCYVYFILGVWKNKNIYQLGHKSVFLYKLLK